MMGLAQQKLYYDGGDAMTDMEEKQYTIADIEALPEGERAELIDGKMYMMATPSMTHQRLIGFLYREFSKYIESNKGSCEPFFAPFAVYLDELKNYVEPDLVIVCDKEKLNEKGCHGAPDLVAEVVSPSSERMDYVIKLFKYRAYGVREYWLVDPQKNRILIYDLEHEDKKEYTFEDCIPVGIYEGDAALDFGKQHFLS